MYAITAEDLKAKGINALTAGLSRHPEIAISVRGKERFVVMKVEHYLRERELEVALLETHADIIAGNVIAESVDNHIKRIKKGIKKLCSN